MDVPAKFAKPPPGIEELIHRPGASKERKGELPERNRRAAADVLSKPSSVEPALTSGEIHAGALVARGYASFAEATTVAITKDRRLSIAIVRASESQLEENDPPPMLMLT